MGFLFLNQAAGTLFRELAEDVTRGLGPGVLVTGARETLDAPRVPALKIEPATAYDRRTLLTRATSWVRYFLEAAWRALRSRGQPFVLMVTNPPFLGVLGPILRAARGHRYAVLVYDVYPALLENYGKIRRRGWTAWLWRAMNRITWERADAVFTLADDMAASVRSMFDARRTRLGRVVVVPPWADTQAIVPVPRAENPFRRQHARDNQMLVLYSGNIGLSHDIESILDAARMLRDRDDLKFMFIGSGAKRPLVEAFVKSPEGAHTALLAPVPAPELRYTLSSADLAVVSLEPEAAGLSFPSKTCAYLAAGAAVLAITPPGTALANLVMKHRCGVVVPPGHPRAIVEAIDALRGDPTGLDAMKARARSAAVADYSRDSSRLFVEALRRCRS